MKKLLSILLLIPSIGFCDTKISALSSTTTLNAGDIIPVVTNPGTNPANFMITKTNLINTLPFIQSTSSLQQGATFYVSSGTVAGSLHTGTNVTSPNLIVPNTTNNAFATINNAGSSSLSQLNIFSQNGMAINSTPVNGIDLSVPIIVSSSQTVNGPLFIGQTLTFGAGITPGHNIYTTKINDAGAVGSSYGWDNSNPGFFWDDSAGTPLMSLTNTPHGELSIKYGMDAATGTFSVGLTVAGQNVCQANGTNCPASGGVGSSTSTVFINGVILSSPTTSYNYVPGTGALLTGSVYAPGSVNLTFAADTAVMLTRATDQANTDKSCVSTTGNTSYTCALNPTLTSYTTGQCLTLLADTSNSTTATLNVDTLGALSVLSPTGGSLSAGNVTALTPATVCLSSGSSRAWILQGGGGGAGNPGGSSTQIQYNNAGSFGGIPGSVIGTSSVTIGPLSITTTAVVAINPGDFLVAIASSSLTPYTTAFSIDTFGNEVLTGSITAPTVSLTGTGNFQFVNNADGKTYQVVGSSGTPTAGDVAVWGASNTIIDGGTIGANLLSSTNTFTGSNTFTNPVTLSSSVVTSGNTPILLSNNGLFAGTTAQVEIYSGFSTGVQRLLSIGSLGQNDQVFFLDQTPAKMTRYGADLGNLDVGDSTLSKTKIAASGDTNNFIDLSDSNSNLEIQGHGNGQDVYINMINGGGEQARWSTVSGMTVQSSETVKGKLGLGVTFGVVAATGVFTSTGTSPTLSIVANGTYGTTAASSGGFFVNCTGGGGNAGNCANFYTGAGAQTGLNPIVSINSDSALWNEPGLYINRANNTNNNSDILVDAQGFPAITIRDNSQTNPSARKWQYTAHNGVLRMENRLNDDSGFGPWMQISSATFFNDVYVGSVYGNQLNNTQFQVQSSTGNIYDALWSTTTNTTSQYAVAITTSNHMSFAGVSPSTTSCGTGAGFTGTDAAGVITPGSAAGGCTVTFSQPYKNSPACTVTERTDSLVNALSYTVSTTALTITQTSLSSIVDYHCYGIRE